MRKEYFFLMTLVLVLLPQAAIFGGDDQIIAPERKLEKLADGFDVYRGASLRCAMATFFSPDQPNNKILKWSTDGKLSTFMEPSGRLTAHASTAREISGPAPTKRTNCGGSIRRENHCGRKRL